MTLLAEFFCKLLYICSQLLRFAGVCFMHVSFFQKRSSQGVRDQREILHTIMVDTDLEVCWDQWQIALPQFPCL